MGYSIWLKNDLDEFCLVEPFDAGSEVLHDDFQMKASISVTFNYRELFNFKFLSGKKAKDTIEVLKDRIKEFGDEKPSDDYWECTKGNVNIILKILLSWAEMYPDATWHAQ